MNGIPFLRKSFCFVGKNPRKIGLVVGVAPRHQLCICAIVVGKCILPYARKLIVAPSEHLFTRGDMMVGNMYDTAFFSMVVPTEIIVCRFRREIRSCRICILMLGDIRIAVIVNTVVCAEFIVVCNGISRYRTLIMETNVV